MNTFVTLDLTFIYLATNSKFKINFNALKFFMKKIGLLFCALVVICKVNAQPPVGYYNSVGNNSCSSLKTALKNIINNGFNPQAYSALWSQYLLSDIKPREVGSGSANVIWDIYSDNPNGLDPYNFTPGNAQCGSYNGEADCYNREHSVPQSWFSGNTSVPGPATDYLHVFPTDGWVNGKRANFIYGEVATASFTSLNGSKLGSSSVAGFSGSVFEPINEYKGDLARAFLYFVTQYQDNIPGWSSNAESTQAFDNSTFPSVKINYLRLMLKWHNQDPVSQKERDRNNAAYQFQGNRNPFVDSPQYVNRIWNSDCPGLSTLPVDLLFFAGKLVNNKIVLNWEVANEINLKNYEVERSFNGTSFTFLASVTATNNSTYTYADNAENNRGKRVYYRLKKVNKDGTFTYSEIFTIHIPNNVKFALFPNPAKDVVTFQMNGSNSSVIKVQITDVTGKTLFDKTYTTNNSTIQIATNTFAKGTYLVKLIVGNETYLQKLIIAK